MCTNALVSERRSMVTSRVLPRGLRDYHRPGNDDTHSISLKQLLYGKERDDAECAGLARSNWG